MAKNSSSGRSNPLIGITCGAYQRATGELYYGVLSAYVEALAAAGGLPLLIPPGLDEKLLRALYERADGVLLTGGGDVDPMQYGMTADDIVDNIQVKRDTAEFNVTRWAADEDKPLFGICRGIQVANVALGGTLYRDIAKEYPGYNGTDHDISSKVQRGHEAHTVEVDSGSCLAQALGVQAAGSASTQTLSVNSMHHQALRDVPARLKITAHSADGLIEGVEMPEARFFIGVQWHPEEMVSYSEPMRRLFAAFVDSARQ